MKRDETLFGAIIRTARLCALLGLVLPMLDQVVWSEAMPRILIGLAAGAAIGALFWPVTKAFRRREREAIVQMQRETKAPSNMPSHRTDASRADAADISR